MRVITSETVMARCSQCGSPLKFGYAFYTDASLNKYCDEDCAKKANDIIEHDWYSEDIGEDYIIKKENYYE